MRSPSNGFRQRLDWCMGLIPWRFLSVSWSLVEVPKVPSYRCDTIGVALNYIILSLTCGGGSL
jgi:hypothetical protein